jgi:uncharacterized membrane protein
MFQFAALTYGIVASFVMASTSRNRREARNNPPLLTLFAWVLTAFSLTVGVGLLGYTCYHALAGTPVAF